LLQKALIHFAIAAAPISFVTEYNSAGENIGELYADGISGANIKMQTTQIKLEVAFVA